MHLINCFYVHSNHGTLQVCVKTGRIQQWELQGDDPDTLVNLLRIQKFDLDEWEKKYGRRPQLGESVDILDLGYYWKRAANQVLEDDYEEPEHQWRADMEAQL